jgi:hypothetical protein
MSSVASINTIPSQITSRQIYPQPLSGFASIACKPIDGLPQEAIEILVRRSLFTKGAFEQSS